MTSGDFKAARGDFKAVGGEFSPATGACSPARAECRAADAGFHLHLALAGLLAAGAGQHFPEAACPPHSALRIRHSAFE